MAVLREGLKWLGILTVPLVHFASQLVTSSAQVKRLGKEVCAQHKNGSAGARQVSAEAVVMGGPASKPVGVIQHTRPVGDIHRTRPVGDIHRTRLVGDIQRTRPVGGIQHTRPVGDIHRTRPVGDIHRIRPVGDIHRTRLVGDIQCTRPVGDIQHTRPVGDIQHTGSTIPQPLTAPHLAPAPPCIATFPVPSGAPPLATYPAPSGAPPPLTAAIPLFTPRADPSQVTLHHQASTQTQLSEGKHGCVGCCEVGTQVGGGEATPATTSRNLVVMVMDC